MACKNEIGAGVAPYRFLVLALLLLPLLSACGSEAGRGKTSTQPDPARATSVSLSSSAVALEAIGATHQLSATVRDQNGHAMSGASVQWSSSLSSVATVSASGIVTSVGVGNATITARSGTVSATASVEVSQVADSLVIRAPASILNELGQTLQFTAEVRDAQGHVIPSAQVTWASSDPDCVSIDTATGLATAIAFGTVTISATSGPASSTSDLPVVYIPSSENSLLSFSFLSADNPGLAADAEGEIEGEDVVILIPREVDATDLTASFTLSPKATVQIDGLNQIPGETEQDFTQVVRYTVTAEDGSTRTYTVYVGRLLEPGEVLGWQRDAGFFRLVAAPRDIKLLEQLAAHLDTTFVPIADKLGATLTDTITVDIYPSKAALHDKLREFGWDPDDSDLGTAIGTDWILTFSPNSPDQPHPLRDLLTTVVHEGIHNILETFGTPIPAWLHEGVASLDQYILGSSPPVSQWNWGYQKYVVGDVGKPGLSTMFIDPAVGYAFSITTVIFMVEKYGWDALRAFIRAPTDFTIFGFVDGKGFEVAWHGFLDELWGYVEPGEPELITMAEARTMPEGLVTLEGTVTWQTQWDDRIYFLQDETGGISTFHDEGAIPLAEGDRIKISGLIGQYRGEVQMNTITRITVLGQGAVPAPRTVTADQINAGQFQGELVQIQGTVQEVAVLAYGNQKVTIRDAFGTDFAVYSDSRTGMTAGDWPAVGTTVQVVGVLGIDNRSDVPEGTGPRVEVRRKEDVGTVAPG